MTHSTPYKKNGPLITQRAVTVVYLSENYFTLTMFAAWRPFGP